LRRRTDLLVDEPDAAVDADEERPTRGKRLILVDHAVGLRDALGRVAQKREIDAERPGESLVRVRRIDADGKIRDVECPDQIAALTERLALRGSAAGERFRKPRDHNRTHSGVIAKPIRAPVGRGQFEVWRHIAGR